MRTMLTVASITAVLAGIPVIGQAAEALTELSQPAVNASFLTNSTALVGTLLGQAGPALDLAKTAASVPFAGTSAKGKVTAAQAQFDAATTLKGELTGLSAGKAPVASGILGSIASGTGPSLADRFKGLPLAGTVQTILGNPEMVKALVSALPLDQVPGYATAAQALSAFAP